jgi:hypothetical protein
MFKPDHLRRFLFAIVLLWGAALFAQHYQGRDHTVFHRPAPPPAKHASTATAASAPASRPSDATRRREPAFSGPSSSRSPQAPQLSSRPR